jgi:hypothetical protein
VLCEQLKKFRVPSWTVCLLSAIPIIALHESRAFYAWPLFIFSAFRLESRPKGLGEAIFVVVLAHTICNVPSTLDQIRL